MGQPSRPHSESSGEPSGTVWKVGPQGQQVQSEPQRGSTYAEDMMPVMQKIPSAERGGLGTSPGGNVLSICQGYRPVAGPPCLQSRPSTLAAPTSPSLSLGSWGLCLSS